MRSLFRLPCGPRRVTSFSPFNAAMAGVVVLYVACGSSGGGDPIPVDDFPRLLADAHCNDIGPCCEEAGIVHDPEQCRSAAADEMQSAIDLFRANGHVAYDGNAARACIDAHAALVKACDGQRKLGDICRPVFLGTLQVGERCTENFECAPGTSCQRPENSDVMQCVSTARMHGRPGEGCWATCTDNAGGSSTCFGGTTPGSNQGNATCFTNEGLYCDETFHCAQQPAIGEPCTAGKTQCAGDAFCDQGACASRRTSGSCGELSLGCASTAFCEPSTQECQLRKSTGDACAAFLECPTTDLCTDGICRRRSIASPSACRGSL